MSVTSLRRKWQALKTADPLASCVVSFLSLQSHVCRRNEGNDFRAQAGLLGAFLGPPCTIDCEFPQSDRAKVTVKGESGKQETLLLFTAHDTVRGQVSSAIIAAMEAWTSSRLARR